MGIVSLFFMQCFTVLFFSSIFNAYECTDIKFNSFDLDEKSFFVAKEDEHKFGVHKFGISGTNAICNNTNKCNNGGSCYNNTCICLPGTSGPLCKTINGCSDLNCGKDRDASCDFDKRNFKAICKCPWGKEFDYDENKCKDCLCTECQSEKSRCFPSAAAVKCEFIRGEKACTCALPLFKFNPKWEVCRMCSCGDNSESCEFDDDGNQICKCKDGYAQSGFYCYRCDCYRGTGCKSVNYNLVCICPSGYVEDRGYCYECTCGENGKCVWGPWNHEQKGCICNPGFKEIDGVCKEISECYCGENSNCTLKDNEKICSCPEGFTYVNGLCTDINECDYPKTCPENQKCMNLIGGYSCSCSDGFQPSKKEGECDDIDECQYANSCVGADTVCFNTVGSFKCVCKPGFATRDGIAANPICEDKSSWKLGFGLLIGFFLAVIIGLVIVIYKKS